MNSKNQSALGALQPFLFCIGMYLLALSFSAIVCFSIVYVLQPGKGETGKQELARVEGRATAINR